VTPTTVRTVAPGRGRAQLPPFPDEVPLPATFGDWYHLAAGNLGVAERRDSGVLRLAAGALLVTLCSFGLGAGVAPVLAVLVGGGQWQGTDVAVLVLGLVVVLATLAWWAWFRRGWARARRLRWAWAAALRDPRVLALPADRRTPGRLDPEGQHPYRSRAEQDGPHPHPGIRSVGGVSGALDALRLALHPLALAAGVLLVVAALRQPDAGARFAGVAAALPLTLAALGGTVRAWYRFARVTALAADQRDDLARWTAWRVLHGLAEPRASRPRWRRADLALLPVALVGLLLYLARLASGTVTTVHLLVGVGLVAVPLAALLASFGVRALRARSGDAGLGVQVLADDVPPQGPTAVAPGPARLELGDAGSGAGAGTRTTDGTEAGGAAVRLVRPDGTTQHLTAVALVSGVPHLVATRRHWLVLADGSQVPLTCAAVRDLRGAAADAGLRVL
jgi:hypothetical protein